MINLGRLGRIECGADTDMTLRLSDESIGGELRSNRVVVSARAGIAIVINTAKSMVTTDGQQPAVLTIYVDRERARVISHVGAASVVSTERKVARRVEKRCHNRHVAGAGSAQAWSQAQLAPRAPPKLAFRERPRRGQRPDLCRIV